MAPNMKSYRQKTAPQPHKVIKEMSLFLGKFEPQPKNAGWSFTKELADGSGYITVTSIKKVSPHDGKMFDFVMSSLFAQRKYMFEDEKGKIINDVRNVNTVAAYEAITIDMSEVLRFRGMTQDTKNKKAIFESLKNMVGMTVEVKKGKTNLIYSVLTSVKRDEINPDILYVKVNEEINKAFYQAGMRFINVERALLLRSDVAVEFTKFLQARGQGIRKNEPTSPATFEHSDVVYFLHLEHLDEHTQIKTLRRAIEAVGKQGFDTFRMKRYKGGIKWVKNAL
jgi:hypothetical protein